MAEAAPTATDFGYTMPLWPGHNTKCQINQVKQLFAIYAWGVLANMGQLKALGVMDPPALIEIDLDKFPKASTALECRCHKGPVRVYQPEQARCPDTGKNIIGWVPQD
jgi:hypothetical protein